MTFDEWCASVPSDIKGDPLWRMEVFQLALFIADLAWHDTSKLVQAKRTVSLADQLLRAAGSISANIAEGYSRNSGKDQARFYEYALGSARESRVWYYQSRHLLPDVVFNHRLKLLSQISRLLLKIIPAQRGRKISETDAPYCTETLLDNPPIPQQ